MNPKSIPGIPEQISGSFHDSESRKLFDDSQSVNMAFNTLKDRFLNINQWKKFCDEKAADFKLFDSNGNHILRAPRETDLIRIDIPGPGNPESQGHEWVKIIHLTDEYLLEGETESCTMVCVPTTIPGQDDNQHIAHFYSKDSSSSFRISKGAKFVKIGIYGRNETPNTDANLIGKIRNQLIALGGMFGMSKIQWKVFADEILDYGSGESEDGNQSFM